MKERCPLRLAGIEHEAHYQYGEHSGRGVPPCPGHENRRPLWEPEPWRPEPEPRPGVLVPPGAS